MSDTDSAGRYGQQQQDNPMGYGYPPQPPPEMDRHQVRATAKAEKARAKALRPWYAKKRWWAIAVIVLLIAVAAASGGDDDGGDTAAGDKAATATAPGDKAGESPKDTSAPDAGGSGSSQDVYAVGDTAHTGDFDVTLLAVEDPYTPTNMFESTQDGHRFVAVEATLTNTGERNETFSSLLGAEVSDQLGRRWDIALAGTDRPSLGGDVVPGDSMRGWLVFEVADDASDLKLRIKGNLTATGSLFALG